MYYAHALRSKLASTTKPTSELVLSLRMVNTTGLGLWRVVTRSLCFVSRSTRHDVAQIRSIQGILGSCRSLWLGRVVEFCWKFLWTSGIAEFSNGGKKGLATA